MSANRSGFLGAPALLVFPSRASPARVSKALSVLSAGLKSTRTCTSSSPPFQAACAEPAGLRSPHPRYARARCPHPQAKLTGENLETFLLPWMDVVRTRGPAGRADPIDLEQLAARLLDCLPEHGPESRHRVY